MAKLIVDDRARELRTFARPRRVVSLVPSETYNLWQMGLGESLVGVTDHCNRPKEDLAALEGLTRIGGTKNPDCDAILKLSPDLVLSNQEENRRQDVETLEQAGVRVCVSFPKTYAQGLAHVARLSQLMHADKSARVRELLRWAYRQGQAAKGYKGPRKSVFVPIWLDPLMTANEDTFLSDMLIQAGGQNAFAERVRQYPLSADLGFRKPLPPNKSANRDTRYPRIQPSELEAAQPDLILLPDEPHPFGEKDVAHFKGLAFGDKSPEIVCCEGAGLTWPGVMAAEALPHLAGVLLGEDAKKLGFAPPPGA